MWAQGWRLPCWSLVLPGLLVAWPGGRRRAARCFLLTTAMGLRGAPWGHQPGPGLTAPLWAQELPSELRCHRPLLQIGSPAPHL